jgi:FixJ family two-component response regulator
MTEVERYKVAIVDDDVAVRDSLQFLLEVLGYSVEAFASAADFLKAKIGNVACLILDHHMPEMTGLELIDRLRTEGNALPVLLVTGLSSPAIVSRAAELGVSKVLDKPPGEDDLLDFIAATYR